MHGILAGPLDATHLEARQHDEDGAISTPALEARHVQRTHEHTDQVPHRSTIPQQCAGGKMLVR